jgi:group I intron endonuclease
MIYSVYHITTSPGRGELLNYGYIGITKNPELRFTQHGWNKKNSNKHLRNAIAKYKDNIKFVILAKDLDYEAACLLEEMLRPEENMGWNIAKGGSVPPSPKGKERSATYRQNISKAKMGDKNPMFGKKIIFSEEHRSKLSSALKGKQSKYKNVPRIKIQCPHCNKIGGTGAMNLWHFDNCKLK